jgi:hypothetical protein
LLPDPHRIIVVRSTTSLPVVASHSALAKKECLVRVFALSALVLSFSVLALAQAPSSASVAAPMPGSPPAAGTYSMTPILTDLDRLQSASSATDAAIARLKIEKWKTDSNSKRQAESNAESIQRNLKFALPGIISSVRSAPQDVAAEFKLYRNLNALYDVMSTLTESAGAFGPKGDYDALGQQLEAFDSIRRNLGDALEQLALSNQSQLDQLRTQVRTLQAQAAAAPPKKTVVDDDDKSSKTTSTSKKKAKKPASKPPDTSSGTTTPTQPQ